MAALGLSSREAEILLAAALEVTGRRQAVAVAFS
jgi:hypothetical protein